MSGCNSRYDSNEGGFLQDPLERAELLKKYQCPNCKKTGDIREVIENDEIWAKCYRCKKSGYKKRITYDNMIYHLDVFCTIYDTVKSI